MQKSCEEGRSNGKMTPELAEVDITTMTKVDGNPTAARGSPWQRHQGVIVEIHMRFVFALPSVALFAVEPSQKYSKPIWCAARGGQAGAWRGSVPFSTPAQHWQKEHYKCIVSNTPRHFATQDTRIPSLSPARPSVFLHGSPYSQHSSARRASTRLSAKYVQIRPPVCAHSLHLILG